MNKKIIQSTATKQQNNTLTNELPISNSFVNVVDALTTRVGATGYTLAQFFESYLSFMKNNEFVHTGNIAPTNNHIKIWIDTSITNQDGFKA